MQGHGGGQVCRNVVARPHVWVVCGRDRFAASARVLDPAEAVHVLAGYEQRHQRFAPVLRALLGRLLGWRYDGSDEAKRRAVTQLPMVALRPLDG